MFIQLHEKHYSSEYPFDLLLTFGLWETGSKTN